MVYTPKFVQIPKSAICMAKSKIRPVADIIDLETGKHTDMDIVQEHVVRSIGPESVLYILQYADERIQKLIGSLLDSLTSVAFFQDYEDDPCREWWVIEDYDENTVELTRSIGGGPIGWGIRVS